MSNPAMAQMAAQIGLGTAAALGMIGGESWGGIHLKPIDAALPAPAFEPEQQKPIAAALQLARKAFWEGQYFYLDEMAGAQARETPNALMRETSLLHFVEGILEDGETWQCWLSCSGANRPVEPCPVAFEGGGRNQYRSRIVKMLGCGGRSGRACGPPQASPRTGRRPAAGRARRGTPLGSPQQELRQVGQEISANT